MLYGRPLPGEMVVIGGALTNQRVAVTAHGPASDTRNHIFLIISDKAFECFAFLVQCPFLSAHAVNCVLPLPAHHAVSSTGCASARIPHECRNKTCRDMS